MSADRATPGAVAARVLQDIDPSAARRHLHAKTGYFGIPYQPIAAGWRDPLNGALCQLGFHQASHGLVDGAFARRPYGDLYADRVVSSNGSATAQQRLRRRLQRMRAYNSVDSR